MRVLVCCLFVLVTTTTLAPTSEDLRQMYGASTNVVQRRDGTPNSESFLLSPNIKLTVQYGSDKQACIMTLEPDASQEREEHGEQVMSSTRISAILEQGRTCRQERRETTRRVVGHRLRRVNRSLVRKLCKCVHQT